MGGLMKSLCRIGLVGLALLGTTVTLAPEAEASKFANAYNMPDLAWKTIETEHFRVHYPVSRRSRRW